MACFHFMLGDSYARKANWLRMTVLFRLIYHSSKHTAWQLMPSPEPVKPRCSSVVAFTFT